MLKERKSVRREGEGLLYPEGALTRPQTTRKNRVKTFRSPPLSLNRAKIPLGSRLVSRGKPRPRSV